MVCDAYTGGACVAVNAPVLAATTGGGAIGGAALGKGACVIGQAMGDSLSDAYNWIRQKVSTNTSAVTNTQTGVKIAGQTGTKNKSDCGEQKGYKDSQDNNYAETADGTKMDRDHIPPKQYMIEKAKIMAQKMKKGFNDCVKKAIINEAKTIMIPKTMHGMGYSYGQSADAIKASGDLSKSANDIAKRDVKTYKDLMDKNNPKNKKGNPLSKEEKKKMDDISDDCKEKIKDGLKEMEKEDYDKFLRDKINENQDC